MSDCVETVNTSNGIPSVPSTQVEVMSDEDMKKLSALRQQQQQVQQQSAAGSSGNLIQVRMPDG